MVARQKNRHSRLVKHSSLEKTGNCSEYSHITADALNKMGIQSPIEIFYCEDDQYQDQTHVFNVIGRSRFSISSNYKTWGEKAIVCDSQNGKVFFASEIPLYLTSWMHLYNKYEEKITSYGNIAVTYNPRYHTLHSYMKTNAGMGFFKSEKHLQESRFLSASNNNQQHAQQQNSCGHK